MRLRYDQVIETLLFASYEVDGFAEAIDCALIVRTPEGRVRLVLRLKTKAGWDRLCEAATGRLEAALGPWFQGPIISPAMAEPGLRQIAERLLSELPLVQSQADWLRAWPSGWPVQVERPGDTPRPLGLCWRALQVAIGKQPWLPQATLPKLPWSFNERTPRITAFYGFKGGVGRSTLVGILAWNLARLGRRVVCLDLDLEAPGLASLLDPAELSDELRGWVIDDLLSFSATGQGLEQLPVLKYTVHGAPIWVGPAGVLGPMYLEKLARLDFLHHGDEESPVDAGLRGLLKRIRAEHQPDHIFLDCRSGLHDLAGLAIHGLAHVDVLVGRGDAHELNGLEVLLPALARRRAHKDLRLLFIHSMVRDPAATERYAQQLYDLCATHIYGGEDIQGPEATIAHQPVRISDNEQIARAGWLGEVAVEQLFTEEVRAILERLDALWQPDAVEP